ncbi:MAG: DUF4270 domain-containing protein [Bacteroidales bacterium]|nr:DUF4270 domain-containing protein [Bacteroidales bacterium]
MISFFSGCNEDPTVIGKELLPESDYISVGDTIITVDAYTVGPVGFPLIDSLSLPLGYYIDQDFGITKAGFMVELSPADSGEITSATTILDVKLNIGYLGYYGDSLYVPQVEVYNLSFDLDKTKQYSSDFNPEGNYNPRNFAVSATERPDSTYNLQVKLDNEFGYELLHTEGIDSNVLFKSYKIDSVFDAHYKGIYIKALVPEEYHGLIVVNNLGISVDYLNSPDTTVHRMNFLYIPRDIYPYSTAILHDRYIKILEHDFSQSTLVGLNDTLQQSNYNYIQSLGGTQVLLKINDLESLRSQLGDVIINMAQLTIPIAEEKVALQSYFFPYYLGLRPAGGDLKYFLKIIL